MKKILFILLILFAPVLKSQETLVDSYSETNKDAEYSFGFTVSTARMAVYQSFTGDGKQISSCKFYLKRQGTISGNCHAVLWAHTGEYGVSSKGTGDSLAYSDDVDVETISNSAFELVTFTFSTSTYTLVDETHYIIAVRYLLGDASNNNLLIGYDGSSVPSEIGNMGFLQPSDYWNIWADAAACFYVYGTPAGGGGAGQVIIVGE